jgi:hypothetical protein
MDSGILEAGSRTGFVTRLTALAPAPMEGHEERVRADGVGHPRAPRGAAAAALQPHEVGVIDGEPIGQGGVQLDERLGRGGAELRDAAGLGTGLVVAQDPAGRQVQRVRVVSPLARVAVSDGMKARAAVPRAGRRRAPS